MTTPFDAMIDAAAAKWPQTDDLGRTLADEAAAMVDARQVHQQTTGAWIVDGAHVAADASQCDCHARAVIDPTHGRICAHRVAVWFVRKLRTATAQRLGELFAEAQTLGARVQLRTRVTYRRTGDVKDQQVEILAARIDAPGRRYEEFAQPAPITMDDLIAALYNGRYAVDPAARTIQGRHHAGQETWAVDPMAHPDHPGDPVAATKIAALWGWDADVYQRHQFDDYSRRAA